MKNQGKLWKTLKTSEVNCAIILKNEKLQLSSMCVEKKLRSHRKKFEEHRKNIFKSIKQEMH